MSKSFITGFPRIGEQRELKFALESFWAGKSDFSEVYKTIYHHLSIRKNAYVAV